MERLTPSLSTQRFSNTARALEELKQINRITVKPLSAIFGKIKLTQPAAGTIRIVINENNLTRAFN